MVPSLIFLLLRKYYKSHPKVSKHIIHGIKVSLLFILSIVIVGYSLGQQTKLLYQITRNGNVVGNILVSQSSVAGKIILKLESDIKTRFLFAFTAKAREETTYENGMITYSSIYRKLNGNEKCDKKLTVNGNYYQVIKKGKMQRINYYPIRNNMLSLYSTEPHNFSQVYSDNFQQLLGIQKINTHQYKIVFPDGNYNEYHYDNGICSRIKIHHSLYSAQIDLTEIIVN